MTQVPAQQQNVCKKEDNLQDSGFPEPPPVEDDLGIARGTLRVLRAALELNRLKNQVSSGFNGLTCRGRLHPSPRLPFRIYEPMATEPKYIIQLLEFSVANLLLIIWPETDPPRRTTSATRESHYLELEVAGQPRHLAVHCLPSNTRGSPRGFALLLYVLG
ncbi:hypothetical protein MBM_03145 [Drepanopeziza brunnea f. sp. 'multigermtubi' MB_m1]|uniref:Uncharacterized protein n=1 Tax=Marssonina brunnea f. sp. multigermtubi (strain MB_m1) TaxID=1072389 RepID=K1XDF5_MARBU|nr:uncharacterized protein MBM_03145 [Drepanopeziza brunnea f. sp. 'multigermtubi' MB_m1]EKD18903.1 hypothetical protein MBM_03145 [Drepanopeziza brunnea f. sp. 'multigermtubi' MB_m1]